MVSTVNFLDRPPAPSYHPSCLPPSSHLLLPPHPQTYPHDNLLVKADDDDVSRLTPCHTSDTRPVGTRHTAVIAVIWLP